VALHFTVKQRLLALSIGLSLIPLSLGVWFTGETSLSLIQQSLNTSNQNLLVSIRENKKQQITNYLENIQGQISTYAGNEMIIAAVDEFNYSFEDYLGEYNAPNDDLTKFYNTDFKQKFKSINKANLDVSSLIPNTDSTAYSLQTSYIAHNPNPIGSKDALELGKDSTMYSQVHQTYHGSIRKYLQEFGFYDIFIVSKETGDVVYSVYKEIDFATNLNDGAFAQSGLGKAFQGAKNLAEGEVYTTNFSPYQPSYNAQATFMASPIYDQGQNLGVLIFQLPVDRITNIMTNDKQWKSVGLGNTGETYLVGEDKTLRSESRLLLEQPEQYFEMLQRTEQTAQIDLIEKLSSSVGIQNVTSQGVELALNKQTGFTKYIGYKNTPVLSAYTYIDSGGETWALIAEIEEEEAFSTFVNLKAELSYMSVITVILFLIVGSILGYLVARSISEHLNQLSDIMNDIAKGDGDLTAKIEYDGINEFGDISRAFNEIINKFHSIIYDIRNTSKQILVESDVVLNVAKQSQGIILSQTDATRNTVAALEQFEASIATVSKISDESQAISLEVVKECETSSTNAALASDDIQLLMTTLQETSHVVNELNNEVKEITSVLDLITSIADQTNLLALNAAIEAARAGEHGRGFSVVADEVRNLASRTQESTVEIQKKLEILDKTTNGALASMDNATNIASKGSTRVLELKETIDGLTDRIHQMEQLIVSVATATDEQTQTIGEINKNMSLIDHQSKDVAQKAVENEQAANKLTDVSKSINTQVSQFKLND
jgi:methyl-accepting chemotaxis protein